MYVSKSEGANFWLEVLSDLQNRGVRDCIDGLKGFPDAIQSVFPNTELDTCIGDTLSCKMIKNKHWACGNFRHTQYSYFKNPLLHS